VTPQNVTDVTTLSLEYDILRLGNIMTENDVIATVTLVSSACSGRQLLFS